MTTLKLACAVMILSAATAAPALAGHRTHHHHHRVHHHPSSEPYTHNYGPPVWPGETFATYDGPLSALCGQGAAAYRGQDGRRHPCY
ncbi:hypothetical protein DNX69_19940 [Rhodopseudomonas palustris]|uniref:Uncharacterized protein n=1 Tax=Rhodopseudomonas palustris TaxID=1076 RepID=A0A323UBQ4_RHOPL|nr:hypothetical protein [Rhodopseudomonas palustris]PZA10224.1 hypothetical protein DNX69_19940 [Rhodopseudomonas palustris]